MFLLASFEGQWRKYQDPDPLVRGTDPLIRIRTKMSRIRNTDSKGEENTGTHLVFLKFGGFERKYKRN